MDAIAVPAEDVLGEFIPLPIDTTHYKTKRNP